MTHNTPRHPIVIIGAGIAGLAAAVKLHEAGVPYLVLERFTRAGGRFTSREGDGWIADHGTPFINRRDERILGLIRWTGMEEHRIAIQGGIHRLRGDGTIAQEPHGGIDPDRLCMDTGFGELCRRIAAPLNIRYNTAVGAVRWDNDQKFFWWDKEGQVFWFEDETGEPLRDPVTKEVVLASGVILATTATAATAIARRSRSLAGVLPYLESVKTHSTFTGMYKLPRVKVPYYALRGDEGSKLAWLSFEEAKAPERIGPQFSLMVVHASSKWSNELKSLPEGEAMSAVYQEARQILFQELPERPISQTYKRWHTAQVVGEPLGVPANRGPWPVSPHHAPFALAGDYLFGRRAEDAARSGEQAVELVLSQLPRRRTFLGLELAT